MPDEAEEAGLEAGLRDAAVRFDPVPAELIQAAVAAFSWRTADAELAALAFELRCSTSLVTRWSAARGTHGCSRLQAGQLTIEVEVTGTGSSRELVGQLIPAQRAGHLEIRHGTRADRIAADDLGRFRAESVPAGPVSLYCRLGPGGPGAAVVTDWVSL